MSTGQSAGQVVRRPMARLFYELERGSPEERDFSSRCLKALGKAALAEDITPEELAAAKESVTAMLCRERLKSDDPQCEWTIAQLLQAILRSWDGVNDVKTLARVVTINTPYANQQSVVEVTLARLIADEVYFPLFEQDLALVGKATDEGIVALALVVNKLRLSLFHEFNGRLRKTLDTANGVDLNGCEPRSGCSYCELGRRPSAIRDLLHPPPPPVESSFWLVLHHIMLILEELGAPERVWR